MNPRERTEAALRRYAERSAAAAEPACANCGHVKRLHATLAPWCAHPDCARPCSFEPEARP